MLLNQATATGVRELAAGFEKATGNKVKIDYRVGQALYQKIMAGAPGDLASLGSNQFDEFIKAGKIDGNSVVEYGRVGNGVATRAGEPLPDIRTPEALKRALLEAKSIGHTKVGTGPFNTQMFQKLGIYDQIKDKIKIVDGKLVAQAVLDGDVELGIQQTNVIQPLVGTVYLGPLPPELMEYGSVGIGVLTVLEAAAGRDRLHQVHGRSGQRRPPEEGLHVSAAEVRAVTSRSSFRGAHKREPGIQHLLCRRLDSGVRHHAALGPPYVCHTPGSIPVLRMTGAASGAVRYRSSARPASAAVAPLCTPAENTVTSWISAGSAPR